MVAVPVSANGWSLNATAKYGAGTYGSPHWYLDANADGVLQSSERSTPLDQAVSGTGQTGNVESGRLVRCLVEFTGLPAGRTYTVTARSTSLMEPATAATPPVYQDVSAPVSLS